MKKLNSHKFKLLFLTLGLILLQQKGFAQEDTIAAVPIVKIQYFSNNNSLQYLLLESRIKKAKVFTPQINKAYDIYLDSSDAANLLAHVNTDAEGKAKVFIPPSLKSLWDASSQHTFIVKEGEEELIADYIITKSKIAIDTASADGAKSIMVTVTKQENNGNWNPVADVEMKIGVNRMGGILPAGEEATYTTDSSGIITVEFKRDGLPGDEKGNIILTAKVDDNELLGNLQVEKTVPWGMVTKPDHSFFDKRTLWTTRFRTPYWLLFAAYSIVLSVWGAIAYLIFLFIKIRRLGRLQ